MNLSENKYVLTQKKTDWQVETLAQCQPKFRLFYRLIRPIKIRTDVLSSARRFDKMVWLQTNMFSFFLSFLFSVVIYSFYTYFYHNFSFSLCFTLEFSFFLSNGKSGLISIKWINTRNWVYGLSRHNLT